jgi:hypothetical protein
MCGACCAAPGIRGGLGVDGVDTASVLRAEGAEGRVSRTRRPIWKAWRSAQRELQVRIDRSRRGGKDGGVAVGRDVGRRRRGRGGGDERTELSVHPRLFMYGAVLYGEACLEMLMAHIHSIAHLAMAPHAPRPMVE